MKLSEFKHHLSRHPNHELCFVLPDGGRIPAQMHITEVGRVDKMFVDCGGTMRSSASCLLQAWLGNDEHHRLAPQKLANILGIAEPLFRGDDLDVEVEYEDDLLSQFPVDRASVSDEVLYFHLTLKHTDCLAKESCGVASAGCCGDGKTSCC